MKRTLSKLILTFLGAGVFAGAARAESPVFFGGWSGNGGDLHAAASNAWFAGGEPIEACIETREFTALSPAETKGLIIEAIADWKAFFHHYGLGEGTFNKATPFGALAFPDGQSRGLTTDFVWKTCDQLTDNEHAIRFSFGKPDEAVLFFREMATENAYGLALRRSYDHKTYRSGGVVWISGDLKTREELKHLLLHELGHVFGMQHDAVFVMDGDIARHLTDLREGVADFLGRIETPAWPYALRDGDSIVMTSHGRRPPIGGNAMASLCGNQQYRPNRILPPFVLEELELTRHDCHRIEFRFLGTRPMGGGLVELRLKELRSGKERSWNGEFYPEPDPGHNSLGPGIFTQWMMEGVAGVVKRAVWQRMELDDRSPRFPAQGYIQVEDDDRLALQISSSKGLRLQIFFPEVGRYWILRTVHDAERGTEMAF